MTPAARPRLLPPAPDRARARRIADEVVERLGLELDGLVVYTEAATGPYLWTPLVAALAGADRVWARAADSRHGAADEVREATREAAAGWGLADRVEVVLEKRPDEIGEADVVTNTGHVRPIDRETVGWMKPTAAVPLMWETWEFREGEVDLAACREKGIVVLGTDESDGPYDLYPYAGHAALALMYELGVEGLRTRAAVLGGGEGLGRSVVERLREVGVETAWFADDEPDARAYAELPGFLEREARNLDILLCAEHRDDRLLVGPGGLVDPGDLAASAPGLRIGVIAGNVDADALETSGLRYAPEVIRPFGYMSWQAADLGPRAILELYGMGLAVGGAVTRARRAGLTPAEAAARALEESPAMDFPGERAWTGS